MPENKIKTALYLSPRQVRALKAISKDTQIPMSQLIRNGVDLIIQKKQKSS